MGVSKEIREEVYEFIKKNPNRTKRQVVIGMKKKKVCSRLPVLDAIDELMSENSGLPGRVEYSKNTPRGPYHLYVNEKNDFYRISEEIDHQLKSLETTNEIGGRLRNPRLRSMMYLMQVSHFTGITNIVRSITVKIKSAEDREILYLRLKKLLDMSAELNSVLAPFLLKDVDNMIDDFGGPAAALGAFKVIRDVSAEILKPNSNLA